MKFDLIPAEVKIIAVVVLVSLAAAFGWHANGVVKDSEISALNLAQQQALGKALEAKSAAEERATELEHSHTIALDIATTTFEEKHEADKTAADRRIADLNTRVTSLLVSTRRAANPGGCALPGPAAAAGRSDGEATETLSAAVAGRLARRYADYNEIVGQLELCQATVLIDRK